MTKEQRYRLRRKAAIAAMPKIPCACGCGTPIPPLTTTGRPAKYKHGHNAAGSTFNRGRPAWNKGLPNPRSRELQLGRKLTAEQIARRTATRLARQGGRYQVKNGWKQTPESRAKFTAAVRRRIAAGERSAFLGKTHTPEARAKISKALKGKLAGERNPAWRGGISKLAYGSAFTRELKQVILERDGHRCRRCGRTAAEAPVPLHVHHLDHNKRNNDPSNLVAACVSCNAWAGHHRREVRAITEFFSEGWLVVELAS
jgi:5-methylcytosine-specific restriction endonuclease McrA